MERKRRSQWDLKHQRTFSRRCWVGAKTSWCFWIIHPIKFGTHRHPGTRRSGKGSDLQSAWRASERVIQPLPPPVELSQRPQPPRQTRITAVNGLIYGGEIPPASRRDMKLDSSGSWDKGAVNKQKCKQSRGPREGAGLENFRRLIKRDWLITTNPTVWYLLPFPPPSSLLVGAQEQVGSPAVFDFRRILGWGSEWITAVAEWGKITHFSLNHVLQKKKTFQQV